jgi:4-amino-4-deoxy-L-arabinose transferase-like glycosyltransferase
MNRSRGLSSQWWIGAVVALALLANLVLWSPASLLWKTLAALLLTAALPGALLVELLAGRSAAPPDWVERIVYSAAAGLAALVVVMLLLSYLPGPLASWQTFVAFDLLILGLSGALWYRTASSPVPERVASIPASERFWLIGGLLAVVVAGAFFRLGNLGYAEFHGDEARAVLRAAAVIQGYDDVLFLHKKGPVEILIPTALFSLTGRLTEATARLPFALTGIAALAALFWLGRSLFGAVAGWTAALLLALDGYLIGFGRIVQYQSIIVLAAVVVILILHRLVRQQRPPGGQPPGYATTPGQPGLPVSHLEGASFGNPDVYVQAGMDVRADVTPPAQGYLILAALVWALGLLAHYEAILIAVPAVWLLFVLMRDTPDRRQLTRQFGVAAAVGGAVLALFYAPFVLHPQFAATYTYLLDRRISGDGFPFNNLADFFTRTTIYSTTYYAFLLIGLAALALIAVYRRAWPGWRGLLASTALLVGLALTLWNPAWLAFGKTDLIAVFFVLAFLPAWLSPRLSAAERALWLWFGLGMVGMLFFVGKPRTHVYTFFIPWALLAGMALAQAWQWLRRQTGQSVAAVAGMAATVLVVALLGSYAYWYFVYTGVEILRTWQQNRPAGYPTIYEVLDNRALFGFPLANGWKAAGMLYRQGTLDGSYSTNEVEFWTPFWYTRGEMRCEDEAAWFFEISNPQPDPAGYKRAIDNYVSKDFRPWGVVEINGAPRRVIHQRGQGELPMQTFKLQDYAPAFDAQATPELPLGYPVVEPPIAHPLHVNLGDLIWLEGYALEYTAPLRPGDAMRLTLYWRAQQPIDASYKVFNQSYYGDGVMVAQQDGYPVCGGRGTWLWDPGELVADTHMMTIKPDAPDGLYPLFTGMYIEETFERLDILDDAGNAVGDQIHLTDIRVGEE